jgi:PadR family transcriptional regulator PadR
MVPVASSPAGSYVARITSAWPTRPFTSFHVAERVSPANNRSPMLNGSSDSCTERVVGLLHLDILGVASILAPPRMSIGRGDRIELLQGTLDLLILQALRLGPAHGHTIMQLIQQGSDDVLRVEQGSLYPALHRLIKRGWISFEQGTSENNRRAKYYRLTLKGRKQLSVETSRWQTFARAIARLLGPV